MGRLGDRSFGVVLLLLALVGVLQGVSVFAGVLLTMPAFQMIMARPSPVLPSGIALRPIGTRQLVRLLHWIVPVLRRLEKIIYPRWLALIKATKRAVGGVVLLLGLCLLVPVPLSNAPPALPPDLPDCLSLPAGGWGAALRLAAGSPAGACNRCNYHLASDARGSALIAPPSCACWQQQRCRG